MIDVELVRRDSMWVAHLWGKSSPILRPVPGNSRPASAARWLTIDAAREDLPRLLGSEVRIIRIDGRSP